MAEKITTSERIEYLDSVRGLAALCVFFSHFFGSYGSPPFLPEWIWFPPITLVGDGYAAVSVFFVLSGLVLILNFFYPRHKDFHLSKELGPYIASRLLRIVVPFGVMVLVTYVVYHFFYPVEHAELLEPSDWALAMVPQDRSFLQAVRQLALPFPTAEGHFLPQDWTLSIELYASMLVPFLLLVMRSSDWAAAFFVALFLRQNWFFLHFFLGMLTAKHFRFFQGLNRVAIGYRIAAALLLIPIMSNETMMKLFHDGYIAEGVAWGLNAVGMWGLLVLIISSKHAQKILNLRALVFLGRISYSTYLVHFLVLLMATPRIIGALDRMGFEHDGLVYGITIGSSTLIVIFASWAFHEVVEQPTIRFSRQAKKSVAAGLARISAKLPTFS